MAANKLDTEERVLLLKIARQAIENAVNKIPLPELELSKMPQRLQKQGASFVTLTIGEKLRGCIGTLQAVQPLALDVQEHAVAATLDDYRFPPVSPAEVGLLNIEISCLTPSQPLEFQDGGDLINKLRPGIDGVVLRRGTQHATFLPQVWESLPQPEDFLSRLCLKMGAPPDIWKHEKLQMEIYQVEEFKETH